ARSFDVAERCFEMTGHIWLADLAIFSQKGGADGVGGAPVKSAGEGDDVLASGGHAGHAHRILIRFRSGITEESFREFRRRNRNQFLGSFGAGSRVNEIGIEQKLL